MKEQIGLSRDYGELESFLEGAENAQLHSAVAGQECGPNVGRSSALSRDTGHVDFNVKYFIFLL